MPAKRSDARRRQHDDGTPQRNRSGTSIDLRRKQMSKDTAPNDPIEKRLREAIIGDIEPQTIVVADYDPAWPERFRYEEARIRAALGAAALSVEHIGSTSVPGLAAKPILDVLLVVEDSGDEGFYVPAIEGAGYVLRVREPGFDEHRMFRTPAKDVHVHVFSAGSPEIDRYLLLRERLREDEGDRELYARTKRELASREWPSMQHYAEAKTEVIEGIIARAAAAPASKDS
jgi:GrpB-like predicted nucleotidyltransferase (UPF0157 family)